jgi:hypothetical protein
MSKSLPPRTIEERIDEANRMNNLNKQKRSGGCLGLLLVGFIFANFLVNI